jgi:hypothetical protein
MVQAFMTTVLVVAFATSFTGVQFARSEQKVPDEEFGMGLVDLSVGRVESAKRRFAQARSANATAVLHRLMYPESDVHPPFDLTDPTWEMFRGYLVELAKKAEYRYLRDVLESLDSAEPAPELGRLGLFWNVYFSPRSGFITIYCTNKTLLVRTDTGKLVESIDRGMGAMVDDAKLILSENEETMLRIIENHWVAYGEDAKKSVAHVERSSGEVRWKREFTHRVDAGFKTDYSGVVVINYKAGREYTDVAVYELSLRDGEEMATQFLKDQGWEEVKQLADRMIAGGAVDYFPEIGPVTRVESQDKKFIFQGNRNSGRYELRSAATGKVIQTFQFASDVE